MIYIRDLIRKKREKIELTKEEIDFFVFSYNRDEILKEQAASLLTLMYTNGLTVKEMQYLSQAIAETGNQSEIYKLSNQIVDVHPIGGMDDKIVIMLLAIFSALNLPSAKIISREIGIKDKLLNAKIYKTNHSNIDELEEKIQKKEIILFREPENTAPVENKLYKLRNDIACNDDTSLIAISLMSQKIALGVRNMVFDISYGEQAYVKTLKDAEKLARYLIQMGKQLNKGVKCIITRLEEPLGNFFGSGLELMEAIQGLKGKMEQDVQKILLEVGNLGISLITNEANSRKNIQLMIDVIQNGEAYKKLIELLDEKEEEIYIKPKNIIPVMSQTDGYINKIDVSKIRTNAKYLNAIRYNQNDEIDLMSGIQITKKIGEKVSKGEILGYIYTNDDTKVQNAVQNFKEAYEIIKTKPKYRGRIVETL